LAGPTLISLLRFRPSVRYLLVKIALARVLYKFLIFHIKVQNLSTLTYKYILCETNIFMVVNASVVDNNCMVMLFARENVFICQ